MAILRCLVAGMDMVEVEGDGCDGGGGGGGGDGSGRRRLVGDGRREMTEGRDEQNTKRLKKY